MRQTDSTLHLLCPAKLNLFLHILGRRNDGYHNLQTLFQLLDYGDELTLSLRNDSQCCLLSSLDGVNTTDNLIIKAAHLLREHTGSSQGVDITLTKRLPMGGGLGGGSSDAASTLVGLNQLWQTGLTIRELASLGLQLGADVPVFVYGQSSWAEGVGENLKPVDIPEFWYVILKPNCSVSTAEIFSHQELTRDTAAITVAAFFEQGGRNDCETVVCELYPEVQKAINWLGQYGKAQLTGTGACVFAAFSDRYQAQAILEKTPTEWSGFIAKGVNQSPLHQITRDQYE